MAKCIMQALGLLILLCSFVEWEERGMPAMNGKTVVPLYSHSNALSADNEAVFSCTSEDGVMKFICWDTGQGGTCPDYSVICQFLTKDGTLVTKDLREEEGMAAWVSEVHAIKRNDGSTYYIAKRSHQASSIDGYMWMDGFMIDADTLKYVSVFDGGDDLDECVLEKNYNKSEWYRVANGKGWKWLFEYDARTRDLYVPQTVYVGDFIPVFSDRYIVYHFNGHKFVYKGECPHKNIYESLSEYERLVKYFRTKNYIVRVDIVDNRGTLRYASWKATADMSKQPELVIRGGRYDRAKGTYTFVNDGYEYVIGDDKVLPDGSFDGRNSLLVRKEGRVLLREYSVEP